MMRRVGLVLMVLGLTACGPARPGVNEQTQLAVQQTLAAMPTDASKTIASPMPPATEVPLNGLFCEYQFCIGHPAGMAFFDVVAKNNPSVPTASTLEAGQLAAYNSSLFLEVIWQSAAGGSDGQFMLDEIVEKQGDSRNGDVQPILLHDLDVFFVPISSTGSTQLPYGGAAAWACGGRAFAWKAYAMQPDLARSLLTDALQVFRCDR
jgi:hypothetical protein